MNTTTLQQFIICNKAGKYFDATQPAYQRHFTPELTNARIYSTESKAREALVDYFGSDLTSHAIANVERVITTELIKVPDFSDNPSDMYKDDLTEFSVLNREYNKDPDEMSSTDYRRWGMLKRTLSTQNLIDRELNPLSGKHEWVIV